MSLRWQALLPLVLFALAIVVSFAVTQSQERAARAAIQDQVLLHQRSVRIARDLRYESQARFVMAMRYTGGPTEAVMAAMDQNVAGTLVMLDELRSLTSRDAGNAAQMASGAGYASAILDTYIQLRAPMPDLYRAWFSAVQSGDPGAPVRLRQLEQQYRIASASLDDLAAFNEALQLEVLAAGDDELRRLQRTLNATLAGVFLLAFGVSIAQTSSIVAPLSRLSAAARAVDEDREADFRTHSRVREIRSLSATLGAMVANMRQATREAREQEERFQKVLHAAPLGIVVVDPAGAITLSNPWAERLFAYGAGRLEGTSVLDLLPGLDLTTVTTRPLHGDGHATETHRAPSSTGTRRLEARRNDASVFPADVGLATFATDGKIRYLVVVDDATTRVTAERVRAEYAERLEGDVTARTLELERKTHELQASVNDLESFSYSVSHDLRSPLRAIDGFIEMLLEDYGHALDAEGLRLFGVVQQNARKMGQLIDDILAFSRAGRHEMQWQSLDMNALASEVWRSLGQATDGRPLRFVVDDLPVAAGDARAVRQVLSNLLGNALKFTEGRDPASIRVAATPDADFVRYAVQDNGVGFDAAHADKLFTLFQRLHGMDEFEGTGVGLAVVKRFVDKHGGRVAAEGRLGEGATFAFTLPREVPEMDALPPDAGGSRRGTERTGQSGQGGS